MKICLKLFPVIALNPPIIPPKKPVTTINIDESSNGNSCTILPDNIELTSISTFQAITNQSRPTPKKPLKKALKLLPVIKKEVKTVHKITTHHGKNRDVTKHVTAIITSLTMKIIFIQVEVFE